MTLDLPDVPPVVWRVSPELAKPHECTLVGIMSRCGGGCCKSPTYWPPTAYGREDHTCGNLGPTGCVLLPDDKPISCLLYPLRLMRGDIIALHHRTRFSKGICRGNHGTGPPLVDALRDNLITLFGEEQVDRVRAAVMGGHGSFVYPSPDLVAQLRAETAREELNLTPINRSETRA